MINDHTALDDDLSNLLELRGLDTEDSKLNQLLVMQTQQELATLRSTPDEQLDCVYITMQITDHRTALDIINNRLLPNARDPILRIDLMASAAIVAGHLQLSQLVAGDLGCQ